MRFWLLSACIFYYSGGTPPTSYDGNNMLNILGQSITSATFKDFSKFWLLDKEGENRTLGLKIYVNPITDKTESITIAGDIIDLSDYKFKKCLARLPLGITLDDDTTLLTDKLGKGEKLPGRKTLRFYNGNIAIEATYSDLKKGNITFLKFSTEAGRRAVLADTATFAKVDRAQKRREMELANFLSNGTQIKPKAIDTAYLPPFKRSIINVFKASKESSFDSIKTDQRKEGNFWNYKYTYNTTIKVPGEKYNMLYNYPFTTSQSDFVVVLKEADSFDKSFASLYHEFEKQLTVNFPASEGWIATCLPGKDKTQLPDLEFRNDKFGAIILDHSQNPSGRHILYLRFLLFSD